MSSDWALIARRRFLVRLTELIYIESALIQLNCNGHFNLEISFEKKVRCVIDSPLAGLFNRCPVSSQ